MANYLDFLPFAALGLGNYAAANLNYGYFDAVAERYQLLHTWSLGVEEQFYLIVPFLLFALWKVRNAKLRNILILVLFAVTIAIGIYFVHYTNQPKISYYHLHTRFYQLFTGVVLATFMHRLPKIKNAILLNGLYLLALLGILSLSYLYDGSTPWPGVPGLWVALLSALLLYLGEQLRESASMFRFMAQPVMRFVGKISYSLYLWHWVVIATLVELGQDVNLYSF